VDAIELLKADHKKVKGLFREFEQTGERAHKSKQRIAEQVFHELEVHSRIEEELFYPAVKERHVAEGDEMVAESIEEHHVVDVLIEELKAMEPEHEQYEAKFKVLTENVEHHIEEEEGEMFPAVREKMGKELEMLGQKMETRKKELMGAPVR
jgi:hypothetical protein